jgi:hypothetical protein
VATPYELVFGQFGSYLLTDDLNPGFDPTAYARGAAMNLLYYVDVDQIGALVELLEAIQGDSGHSMVRDIEREWDIDWAQSPESWGFFQNLISQTLHFIRATAPDRE